MRFFIYCLPRSGSAWLSVFLTGGGSFCFHDPFGDQESLIARMDARPEPVIGAIDTGAYRDTHRVPEARYFSLRRDMAAIQRSSDRFGVKFDAQQESLTLDAVTADLMRIDSARFHDIGYLEFIWTMITQLPFDRERAKIMSEMRIERDVHQYFSNRPHLQNPLRASWN